MGKLTTLGKIVGLFGVQGWVKVYSYTRPPEAILQYPRWRVFLRGEWRDCRVEAGRVHGKGLVARLAGYTDRDQAAELVGAEVGLEVSALPPTRPGEYYWAELIGLEVINRQGVRLGRVVGLMETGANDVLVVRSQERERLIPFIRDVILEVDLPGQRIGVDWDADF